MLDKESFPNDSQDTTKGILKSNDSQIHLLDRFSVTTDKQEFMEVGKKLFPEANQQRLEEMFLELNP